MNKLLTGALTGAMVLGGFAAQAADDVTLQLKWVTQAQFAGYYVALDNGFYADEGLNVKIKPGGPDIAPAQVIAGGGADVACYTVNFNIVVTSIKILSISYLCSNINRSLISPIIVEVS